jgi:hypothetical protein
MAEILICDIDERAVARLEARARRHGRSLQAEAKAVLEQAAGYSREDFLKRLERWDRHFGGKKFSDSADLIREDRRR